MNIKQLAKNLHQWYRLMPIKTNATRPDSPWVSRELNRSAGRIIFDNLATGYRIPIAFRYIHHYEVVDGVGALFLNVGFFFDCPNVYIIDPRSGACR